jgi:hypothetical protein
MNQDIKEILNQISYEFFENNRYKISDFIINKENYSGICNNGYIKIHSDKCKTYWLCQNETEHTTSDWKFHISIKEDDIKKAWDILTKIFINKKCKTGMKVKYIKENTSTPKGREITIYIMKYDKAYDNSNLREIVDFDICDEHSEDFWVDLIRIIEKELKENFIKSNNLANGDLKIGEYTSLRNEAYVFINNENVYPPDEYGWNSTKKKLPFDLKKFEKVKKKQNYFLIFLFGLIIILFSYNLYNKK